MCLHVSVNGYVDSPVHVEEQPDPGLQPQPHNEATSSSTPSSPATETTASSTSSSVPASLGNTTIISTRLEPPYDHSTSVSRDSDSDSTRTTEQEISDCAAASPLLSELRRRRQLISHVAVLAAIVGAVLTPAGAGRKLLAALIGLYVAQAVKRCIVEGVSTWVRKSAVFAAVAAVVVVILVGAGTARTTETESIIESDMEAERSGPSGIPWVFMISSMSICTAAVLATIAVILVAIEMGVLPALLLVAGMALCVGIPVTAAVLLPSERAVAVSLVFVGTLQATSTARAVLPVVVAAGVLLVGAGAMEAATEAMATAAIISVVAAGEVSATGPSKAAIAQAATAAVAAAAVAVVTAAVGAPLHTTVAVGLAAVVAVASAVAAVAVGSSPDITVAITLGAAAAAVGTIVVAETALVMTAIVAVVVGPPLAVAAAIAAAVIIAPVGLELASILHRNVY